MGSLMSAYVIVRPVGLGNNRISPGGQDEEVVEEDHGGVWARGWGREAEEGEWMEASSVEGAGPPASATQYGMMRCPAAALGRTDLIGRPPPPPARRDGDGNTGFFGKSRA